MISHIIDEYNSSPSVFYYIPNFLSKKEQGLLINYLDNTSDFVPNHKFNNGVSRLQKWYQNDKKYFCPLWRDRYPQWESFDVDPTINDIISKVQDYIINVTNSTIITDIDIPLINSCLINKYPTGEHAISPHRDCALSFGEEPTIIGLSLGATRTISFERLEPKPNGNFSFDLESGSIFIMGGSSQKFYLHSLDKSNCKAVRYSMTFREFIL